MEVDRNGLEVLGREQCLDLLRTAAVGRIGITSGALPTILPVNFVLDGERVLIKTGKGTKLDAATRGTVVAFEVDHVDAVDHVGWSVVVTGVAREVTPHEVGSFDTSRLERWAPGQDARIIAISVEVVSGRRLLGLENGSSPVAPT